MRCLLPLVLLWMSQDPEVDRLVQRLGDGDPAAREEATRKIREMGPRAEESLKKVSGDADPEIRTRANALLLQIARDRAQSALEAKERLKVFPRVTVDLTDSPLEDVLKELGRQTGTSWSTNDIPTNRRVTLKGNDLPLVEALGRIGLHRLGGHVYLHEQNPARFVTYSDGVRIAFGTRIWTPKGDPLGTIFDTRMDHEFEGDVRWDVSAIRTDRNLAVERCAIHSPDHVYVASPDLIDPTVAVKGIRRWYCPTPIEFTGPRDGDSWRVGTYQLIVQWPTLRVRSDQAMEKDALDHTLSFVDIKFTLKPGREKDRMGVGIGGGGGGRYGGKFGERFGGKELAWCGCAGQPADKNSIPLPMASDHPVKIEHSAEDYVIGDIASILITFHKPVEEPFEVTSPPLK